MANGKTKITLTLPYPPSINHYYIKGRILSKKAREYRASVDKEVYLIDKFEIDGHVLPLEGGLAMSLLAHPPDRRNRDLDNILKPLKDAMEHAGVYENDNQIREYHEPFKFAEPVKGGKVIVTLTEIRKANKEIK